MKETVVLAYPRPLHNVTSDELYCSRLTPLQLLSSLPGHSRRSLLQTFVAPAMVPAADEAMAMTLACSAWAGLAAGMESMSPEVVGEMVIVICEALAKVRLRSCFEICAERFTENGH